MSGHDSLKQGFVPAGAERTPPKALSRAIERMFGPQAAREAASEYLSAITAGAGAEPGIARTAGSSFNPRPARIVQLLLNDGSCKSEAEVLEALRSSSRRQVDSIPLECSSQKIALCLLIDELRHLHMQVDNAAREECLARAARLLDSETVSVPGTERLWAIARQALIQQKSIQSERE